jgi:signal transduction histidine kinase
MQPYGVHNRCGASYGWASTSSGHTADVLKTAIKTARPLIEASACELTVTTPPQPVHVKADATRLAQVCSNRLNNAAKYTDKTGHIWLIAEVRDGEAVVFVRDADAGVGIAADHLLDIFHQDAPGRVKMREAFFPQNPRELDMTTRKEAGRAAA